MTSRSVASEVVLITAVIGFFLLLYGSDSGSVDSLNLESRHHQLNTSSLARRVKRRTPQNGFFFPIATYTVRHHKPISERGRDVRPETWEYRGQYFYGYRPRPGSGRRQTARLLAAGLPLLLAPLLSIIFSYPVLVPVAQMAAGATGFAPGLSPLFGGRRRRRAAPGGEREGRIREMQVVADYLHQVDYDEKQQSRVMVNYLQCNGLLGTDDHCLERLSCEFSDPVNANAPELERSVTSILLGHMLNNDFIPRPFKRRLKSAAVHGRQNSGSCDKFFCNYVDNSWDYAASAKSPHSLTEQARPSPPTQLQGAPAAG